MTDDRAPAAPPTRRSEQVDTLHGEQVADPYRWLEDTFSAETKDWVSAQNRATQAFLATVPARDEIAETLREMEDRTRYGVPARHGDRWFWTRHAPLADQPVIVVSDDLDGDGRVLLDPNTLSSDGTVAVNTWSVSDDGELMAYAASGGGSDWMTWRVRRVSTGEDLPDVVEWSKFCEAAWLPDGSGFFYGGFTPPADDATTTYTEVTDRQRLMLHRLGTPVSDDELVREDPDPQRTPMGQVTDDGRWLVVTTIRGTDPETAVHVAAIGSDGWELRPLLPDASASAAVVGNDGSTFFVLTDADAPMGRIVAIDLDDPAPERWRVVVPETGDRLLSAVPAGPDALLVEVLHDASSRLRLWSLSGEAGGAVDVPGPMSVVGLAGSARHRTVTAATISFTDAGSVWAHELDTGVTRQLRTSGGLDGIDVDRVHATSADGTEVPMWLVHRRDLARDGSAQTILYGYGGFDVPTTPLFSASRATWVQRGGLLAVANLRGGGEFGRAWYDAGRLSHKQNVFDDVAACARWLAGSGWTRPELISAHGGSNGGLLVGALLTQHPELIGAAVPRVGVMDMLRYHKFTIGWAWTSDFGDPDDPEGYRWVRAYSPLHAIVEGRPYPATLVTTGDHDDRVVPGHSFKFTATLQAAQGGDAPVLVRVETSAGHGMGKPVSKRIAEEADVLAFCEAVLR